MLVHVYPIMTKIIPITDPITGQIQITDPDYGSGITDLRLRIQYYGSGLRIWITNLD